MKSTVLDHSFWVTILRHITERALESTLHVVCIVAVYLLLKGFLQRLVQSLTTRLLAREDRMGTSDERSGRLKTLSGLLESMIGYLLFFVFGILVFKAVGFDIMPFITTASVIGLAIGIGSQKLVKDVISGFFIIVDNMFVVGDTITVGTVTGEVKEMGMRVTRLLDASGRVIFISNGDIGQVINLSRHPVQEFIELALSGTADIDAALKVIDAAGQQIFNAEGHVLKSPPQVTGISAFSASSITVRISVVSDALGLTAEQMRVREAVRDALVRATIPLA